MLWILMLTMPLPYIATLGGWVTAETGRQPWLVYGLLKTADGGSPSLNSGNALFTLIGYSGLYFIVGLLYLLLVSKAIAHGPHPATAEAQA
jgi:cytochrome d ubiquinol oxidase subunit I